MEQTPVVSLEASRPTPKWFALGAAVVLMMLVVRDAWVAEDAYITLRTVDNFVNGFGLRWNVNERVQSYTHPLWMAALSALYACTREEFLTTIALSLATTAVSLSLLVRVARTGGHALAAVVLLLCSRAFMQFSTSGLENPLTHVLVAVFVGLYAVRRAELKWVALATALLALNRTDAVVAVLPALLDASWQSYRERGLKQTARELALGMAPYFAWELFSLFYYGFLFPNTAYAKLNTGLPSREIARQGFTYLLNAIAWDPATPVAIVLGVAITLIQANRRQILLSFGVVLYLVYVVRIGGDFMQGRFLTLPLFLAVCAIAISELPLERPQALAALLAPMLVLWLHQSATEKYPLEGFQHSGIADERAFYRDGLSLMMYTRTQSLPNLRNVSEGLAAKTNHDRIRVHGNVGLFGYFAGPTVYIVDPLALTDPLLARLPIRHDPNWRVGHYARILPPGYLTTLDGTSCTMTDQALCIYYGKLREIVAGPLWSFARIKTLLAMNFGAYDYLIDRDRYQFPERAHAELSTLSARVPEGAPWNSAGTRTLSLDGIELTLAAPSHAETLAISLDGNDDYEITVAQGTKPLETMTSRSLGQGGMHTRRLPLAVRTSEAGFDRVIIRPRNGDGAYAIAYVRLETLKLK